MTPVLMYLVAFAAVAVGGFVYPLPVPFSWLWAVAIGALAFLAGVQWPSTPLPRTPRSWPAWWRSTCRWTRSRRWSALVGSVTWWSTPSARIWSSGAMYNLGVVSVVSMPISRTTRKD